MHTVTVIPIANGACKPTSGAAHGGMQNGVDQEESADRLQHEGTAIGDALRVNDRSAEVVDRPAEHHQQAVGRRNGTSELRGHIWPDTFRWKFSGRGKPDRDCRIDVAATDVAERAGKHHDGQSVRERDPRICPLPSTVPRRHPRRSRQRSR
jgi:hypothetical protein